MRIGQKVKLRGYINLRISAESIDWQRLEYSYKKCPEELYKDLLTHMQEASRIAAEKNKGQFNKETFNMLKAAAVVIYTIYKDAGKYKKSVLIDFTFSSIKPLFTWFGLDDIGYLSKKKLNQKERNSFYTTYIDGGKDLLKSDDVIRRLHELLLMRGENDPLYKAIDNIIKKNKTSNAFRIISKKFPAFKK